MQKKKFKKVPVGASEFIYLGDIDITGNEEVKFEPIKLVLRTGNSHGNLKVINSVKKLLITVLDW